MRNLSIVLTLTVLFFAGCKNKQASQSDESTAPEQTVLKAEPGQSFLLTETSLPDTVDLNMDISHLSLQELRILRHYPYAMHGMHIMEGDMNAYFSVNTKWYEALVYKLFDEDEDLVPLDYKDVKLSAEERAFVGRIEKRIDELKKNNFVMTDNYRLADPANIVNLFQFNEYDAEFTGKLAQNNFVITKGENIQLFHVYEENDYRMIPNFITTDLFLQAFHMFFSYTLKSLEQEMFISTLKVLCEELHGECLRIAERETDPAINAMALFNATYYAIPYYFLTEKELIVPEHYRKYYLEEIAHIDKEEDNFSEFLSFTDAYFPYSLFKPRGHYTRKPELQAYFKAMMWLQTAPFCLDNKEHLQQTIFSAILLNTTKAEGNERLIDLYKSIYEPVAFLVGLPDNLSVMDVADFLGQERIMDMQTALSPQGVTRIKNRLLELAKLRNQIKPKIELSCPDKINFMPQRYLIDNDVLQNVVDVTLNANRAYPKGLDVFAAFGSKPATDLLDTFYKEPEAWSKYPEEMQKMKHKFDKYKGWNSSVYNKWIESLLELQKTDKNYPEFMQTKAWSLKNLNTSLASWAELKHDAILYAEQPMAAECGGGGLPDPIIRGYVEPNLAFWNKLSELITLTKDVLERNKLLTSDLDNKLNQLSDYAGFLITATKKQLAKEALSDTEYYTIRYMGSSLEYFTLSVIDPDLYLDSWSLVQGPDKSIAVVADIYTRNVQGCDKNGILHVATGNANSIYVVVEIAGDLYLTRGATFSYYEFVQPIGTRLTDEEWQQMLEEKKAPPVPAWMHELILDKEPHVDERVFYSSGC